MGSKEHREMPMTEGANLMMSEIWSDESRLVCLIGLLKGENSEQAELSPRLREPKRPYCKIRRRVNTCFIIHQCSVVNYRDVTAPSTLLQS